MPKKYTFLILISYYEAQKILICDTYVHLNKDQRVYIFYTDIKILSVPKNKGIQGTGNNSGSSQGKRMEKLWSF